LELTEVGDLNYGRRDKTLYDFAPCQFDIDPAIVQGQGGVQLQAHLAEQHLVAGEHSHLPTDAVLA
jgi:hypothetical protein